MVEPRGLESQTFNQRMTKCSGRTRKSRAGEERNTVMWSGCRGRHALLPSCLVIVPSIASSFAVCKGFLDSSCRAAYAAIKKCVRSILMKELHSVHVNSAREIRARPHLLQHQRALWQQYLDSLAPSSYRKTGHSFSSKA